MNNHVWHSKRYFLKKADKRAHNGWDLLKICEAR